MPDQPAPTAATKTLPAGEAHRRARRSFTDHWWRRVWLPAARDSLRRRRHMVGSRWWFLRVLPHRAFACRSPQMNSYGWRCQRLWLHGGAHRFRNYVWHEKWADEAQVHYEPLPIHGHSVVTW